MPSSSLERPIPYSPEQMFDLVIDIEHYQDFMPLEFSARVTERHAGRILAHQSLRIGPMNLSFASTALFHKPDWIRIESSSSPFSYFLLAWKFTRLERGSCVQIEVDCNTRSATLAMFLGPWLEAFTGKLISAFEKRAHDIYGRIPAP